MTITLELLVIIVINVLLGGVYIGGLAMAIRFIESQIKRLETKQDKHNNLIERMVKVECKADAAHQRIDKLEGEKE